ncbi:MAG: LysR family transcriptional regulator [Hyphomicrobiaceae bacterium]|nr:LysR family transcriptional regulator [Hyphomicrobiaceae bacterium]
MDEPLPPLSALRAFEAAARHLSFTRAATELGMTQAAVSYQIKILEERVGAPLFLRLPRRLTLTETGERLAPGMIEAFQLIRQTFSASRQKAQTVLTISVVQSFAAKWLVDHIGEFQLNFPNIAVRFDVSQDLIDFNRSEVDVAIRSGKGDWPGLVSHLLIRADFAPMLAPSLAGEVREPADLLKLHRIGPNDPWWHLWFAAAGVGEVPGQSGPELVVDSQFLEGNLALAGRGVAMLTPAFYRRELEAGWLVQPFPLVCAGSFGYWLVYPHARRNAPQIRAFRDWIVGRAPAVPDVGPNGIVVPVTR